MIFRIQVSDFLKSINRVINIVKDKQLAEVVTLNSLYFQLKDNELLLMGNDNNISFVDKTVCTYVSDEYNNNVDPDEVIVVSSETISKIAKRLDSGILEIEVDSCQVKFTYGDFSWRINRVGIEFEGSLDKYFKEASNPEVFKTEEFKKAIDSVGHIINTDIVAEMYRYLYIHNGHMYASNSRNVSYLGFPAESTLIFNQKTVKCLSALLDNTVGDINISVTDDEYVFTTDDMTFTAGIPVLDPFDIGELINLEKQTSVKLEKNAFVQSINRMLVYDDVISISSHGKSIRFAAESTKKESCKDELVLDENVVVPKFNFKISGVDLKNLLTPISGDFTLYTPVDEKIQVQSQDFYGIIAIND